MSTPVLVRSNPTSTPTPTPGKGTVSPPDTCQHQLNSACPHPESPDTRRTCIDTEAEPAVIDPQSSFRQANHVDLDQTQERTVGGKFFNNPYGTVLTTIVELGSTSTLLADPTESQLSNRSHVEQDAAAVKEFRKIVNGRASENSSEETAAAAAGGNVGLERQSLEQKQLAEQPLAVESHVLEHNGTCPSDHASALLGPHKGPNDGHRVELGQASTKVRSECSSPRHLFHIFPDYIQLGSVSQHGKPHHVRTNSTETRSRSNSVVTIYEGCQPLGISEASEDTVGTRYLPAGHILYPSSHEERRSTTRSSTSTQAPRRSVDEWAYGKYNSSTGKHHHDEGTAGQDSNKSQLNDVLGDDGGNNRVSSRSINGRSRSPLRSPTHTPPQVNASEQNQRRSSAPSSLENRETSQLGTASTHTFRSAALESLLPLAAAEGIIIPFTLTPHHNTQARASGNPTTPFETSHSELSVLYHRGDVCRHRAAAYVAKGIEPQDTLLQMLEQVRLDGAVEIRERKDWCWRCRVEKKLDRVTGAAMPKSCCLFGDGKVGGTERARLVDV